MASGIGRRREAAINDGGPGYQERRRKIIVAAADVFQKKGFDGASLGDIATAVGTDRASLYYYISSKEELFHEVVYTAAEATVQQAEAIRDNDQTTADKLSTLVQSLMQSFEDHYPYLFVYIQERMKPFQTKQDPWSARMWELNQRYDDAVATILQRGLDCGEVRPLAPARVLAYGLVGMVNWSHRWFRPTGELTAAEVGKAYADVVVAGLLSSPGEGPHP